MIRNFPAEKSMYDQNTISKAIHTKWAGKTVHFVKETDSTNEWAKQLSRQEAPHGTLAAAEFQSAGKGRLGRIWKAPEGSSVMMSLLLRPSFEPQYASMLTLVMGLSAARAIGDSGIDVSIKWPNDIVASGRKLCGILTEMGLENGKIREVVVGVGINVNTESFPEELSDKATSMYLETGKYTDRNRLIAGVLENFEQYYEKFVRTCDLGDMLEDYNRLLANRDRRERLAGSAAKGGFLCGRKPGRSGKSGAEKCPCGVCIVTSERSKICIRTKLCSAAPAPMSRNIILIRISIRCLRR